MVVNTHSHNDVRVYTYVFMLAGGQKYEACVLPAHLLHYAILRYIQGGPKKRTIF